MTLEDFKQTGNYDIIACNQTDGEVYTAIPEKAIADIASQFCISNDEAISMLAKQYFNDEPEISCPNKNASFWVEPKA